MRIAFGSDHAGFLMRQELAQLAASWGHEVGEFGAASEDPYDYPKASDLVAGEVLSGRAAFGVLLCGTGIGVSIRANRYPGVRAALCCTPTSARLARQHNHANILCLGARVMDRSSAAETLRAFLSEAEDHDARHERRVAELDGNVCPA